MVSSSLMSFQLGRLVLSSGVLQSSWSMIREIYKTTYPDELLGLGIKIYPEAKYTFVVFVAPPNCEHLFTSTLLSGSGSENRFHFLCSEKISSFSVHTPAFELFNSAYKELPDLKSKLLRSDKPVIITGTALGGSVASLFTLWLLEAVDLRKKRPLCITFGSPLIGDASLHQILQNSVNNSCFLHVIDSAQMPIRVDSFMPFGMFFICFDSECICIEDPMVITEFLSGADKDLVGWWDYGKVLELLEQSVLSRGNSRLLSDTIINRMGEPVVKKMSFDPYKKLSDTKVQMIHIEWYIKQSKKNKIGYYDRFKTGIASLASRVHLDIEKHKIELTDYWKSLVEELEKKPQRETWILKRRCLISGTNYRRMIEPLDIAEYYISGQREYRTSGRSHHYVMLQRWAEEEGLLETGGSERRDLSNLLTFDSCFWAEVEEAMIVIKLLKTYEGMRDEALTQKLVCFEEYVWEMIERREVSPEIFLEKSSFMRWWKEYKEFRGKDRFSSSPSHLTEFMDTGMYESYGSPFHLDDRISGSAKGPQLKSFFDEENGGQKVVVLKLHLRDDEIFRSSVLSRIAKMSGVSSVDANGYERISVTGNETMDPEEILAELRKDWLVEIISVIPNQKVKQKKESSKELLEKQVEMSVGTEKIKVQRSVLSGDSGSGSINAPVLGKSTATILNVRNTNDEWFSFCEFLSNRVPPLDISGCKAKEVIDFLRIWHASGDHEALVGRLSAAFEAIEVKLEENPFCSLDVTRYLKERKKETECILVFSCNDDVDVEETLFIEAIVKKLHEQEVPYLKFNLLGKESLDSVMLYRFSVGIMVISKSFPYSSQSLDHLVAIMEHRKAKGLVIFPVYFKVTLSDSTLKGLFEPNLQHLKYVQAVKIKKWMAAMTEIASINGPQWTEGSQFMVAEEVVRNACLRLFLKNSKNLVRILGVLEHSQPSGAEIVGIWGMAGIGKTSVAREIYEILSPQYDLCYFLQDFYIMGERKGLRQMRDNFYSKVFGEEKLSIGASDVKPSFMRDWCQKKKILVVLDDVSNARDVEAVVGGFGWFSHGHRIILTSRRKQVLVQCKVKDPYEIQRLCEFESRRLCKQYLTGETVVISELLSCSSGIPLALKVLGSSVSKQHTNNMMEHLHKLRRNPPFPIQEAFRRSYDGLDENQKNIFLDLACFFRGENVDHVVQMLDACGFLTYLGIFDLIDESLITLLDNRIEIPIPFQDMGRFIVHEEHEDPCERSRLWDSNDIAGVLTNNSGTDAIEGIFLDVSDLTIKMRPNGFSEMHRLRLLKFYCSTAGNECKLKIPQGLDTLPDELRLLHWENYPLEYLPQNFNPENLVEVSMPYSNMEKLWEGTKNLEKLKKIKLSHSRKLTNILTLSQALNLEHIDLEGCSSLVDVSTSIPHGKLVSLNMKDCSRLQSLPAMSDMISLKLLNMSGCSALEEIPDIAPNLKELYLAGTAIRKLPLAIENLTELDTLDLENCERLQQLPFGLRNSRSILHLKLSGCTNLELGKRKRANAYYREIEVMQQLDSSSESSESS